MSISIRPATELDIPALVKLGCNFHASSIYVDLVDADIDQMSQTARMLVESAVGDVLVAVTPGATDGHPLVERVVGMLGLAVYIHPISGARAASELFWWVEPEHRGVTGLRLLHAAENWAHAHDAALLQMIAPTAEVERLYQRLGYERVEVSYHKKLNKGVK